MHWIWGILRKRTVTLKMAGFALAFREFQRNTHGNKYSYKPWPGKERMRSFILSVSSDRWLTPIRNTVLAHAGYAVIPSLSATTAMEVLLSRYVSAMVIGQSIPLRERQRLCSEGRRHGVPAVVLDRDLQPDRDFEVHVDPSDGPEVFLSALAAVLARCSRDWDSLRPYPSC